MKKFLVLLLLTLYMGSSTGATLRMHYCKGQLTDVQLVADEDGLCDMCGAKAGEGCCKSEHKTLKLQDDQKPAENAAYSLPTVAMTLPVVVLTLADDAPAIAVAHRQTGIQPPDGSTVHPTILHCVFRI